MNFEWNVDKAERNRRKHGVSIDDAATAFGGPISMTIDDPDHSVGEERLLLLGQTASGKLVVVARLDDGETSGSSVLGWRSAMNDDSTKKADDSDLELRPRYDFSKGVRGKYASRYAEGTNVVVLDPDVAKVFTISEAVKEALREVARRRAAGAT